MIHFYIICGDKWVEVQCLCENVLKFYNVLVQYYVNDDDMSKWQVAKTAGVYLCKWGKGNDIPIKRLSILL